MSSGAIPLNHSMCPAESSVIEIGVFRNSLSSLCLQPTVLFSATIPTNDTLGELVDRFVARFPADAD